MSPPFLDLLPLFSAATAALAGSLHCAAMCGPLRLLSAGTPGARWKYQSGRGLAYALLGAGAGGLGLFLPWWALLGMIAFGFFLSLARVELFRSLRARALRVGATSPLFLGLVSGLLPCGLLHSWVAAAAATRDPLYGTGILLLLWAGSLPALELAPGLLRKPLARAQRHYPRALTCLLLATAFLPLAMRLPGAYESARENSPSLPALPKLSHSHCHPSPGSDK